MTKDKAFLNEINSIKNEVLLALRFFSILEPTNVQREKTSNNKIENKEVNCWSFYAAEKSFQRSFIRKFKRT